MTTATEHPVRELGWRAVNLDVLRRIEQLPSLSSVVTEFLGLVQRDFFSATDFETVISKDQALVARLLRVANSGMYGKARSIHSIPEAVVLVGLENMKKIVFAVSAEGLTRLRLKNYDYEPSRGYWMHSTAVGLAARAIIAVLPDKPLHGEEAFVAGLLHDVGKLIADDFLDPTAGKRTISLQEEADAVGLNHAELAEYVLDQWRLPDSIVDTIHDHHQPLDQAGVHPGARVLQLAQSLVNTWGIGHGEPIDLGPDFEPDRHRDLLELVGVSEARIPQLVWDVRQQLAGIETLYADDD
jgi:putative nucleotidyltransferase with HDIG domain